MSYTETDTSDAPQSDNKCVMVDVMKLYANVYHLCMDYPAIWEGCSLFPHACASIETWLDEFSEKELPWPALSPLG